MPAGRRHRLLEVFSPNRLEGLLITSTTNVGYLSGFTGDDSALLVTRDRSILISDGRFTLQLEEECADLEVFIRPIGQPLFVGLGELLRSLGLSRVGFEASSTTVSEWESLTKAATGTELTPTRGLVENLRTIKDAGEIDAIRHAVAVAESAFLAFQSRLESGISEKEAVDLLESLLRGAGASSASFPPIVAVGPRSALPHARPLSNSRLGRDELVLVDWGATVGSYKSDLTRVVVTGNVSPDFASIYAVVLEAQRRAIAAVRPGVLARDVDAAARSFIIEEGFGPSFNHSVGHGLGRDVHEAPSLRHVNDAPLIAGMVVTIEPGIYVPRLGGVRIEDDVLVTESGCEVLSSLPKSWESTFLH